MTTLKLAATYTRYLLTSLATIASGMNLSACAALWLKRRAGAEACVILAMLEPVKEEWEDPRNAAPDVLAADRHPAANLHATDGRSVTFVGSHAVPRLIDGSLISR